MLRQDINNRELWLFFDNVFRPNPVHVAVHKKCTKCIGTQFEIYKANSVIKEQTETPGVNGVKWKQVLVTPTKKTPSNIGKEKLWWNI